MWFIGYGLLLSVSFFYVRSIRNAIIGHIFSFACSLSLFLSLSLPIGHNVGVGGAHLLPGNTSHPKTCTNHINTSGNGTANPVGIGSRLPPGK